LAKTAYLAGEPDAVSTLWDREANSIRKKWLGVSAAILAIPEIEEGQELREKADRLVELDEDQSQPLVGYGTILSGEINAFYREAGFRRVKVKG
ncbi:hypothetical protein LCGC14_2240010, partial [marine sediment metagenome]